LSITHLISVSDTLRNKDVPIISFIQIPITFSCWKTVDYINIAHLTTLRCKVNHLLKTAARPEAHFNKCLQI